MRILIAVVHHWNPKGNGLHQSLRPNPQPRLDALRHLLTGLRRLGSNQYLLDMADGMVYPSNQDLRHEITVRLITDGSHTVLDQLEPAFRSVALEVVTKPETPRHLGFQAQAYLGSKVDEPYDLYGYMEDDLVIQDGLFFQKLSWFQQLMGAGALLLPQRMELIHEPDRVDRFYIDGPLPAADVAKIIPQPGPTLVVPAPGGDVVFESPKNPHAGCFFLSREQLRHWMGLPHWLDHDSSFVSPLESAATLGISRSFQLYKPAFANASWFDLQHWGRSFHCLIGPEISNTSPAVSPGEATV